MAKINLGPHEYTHSGKLYGPGVAEVPDGIYDDLVEAMERKAIATNVKVDPTVTTGVNLGAVDDDALIAEVKKRQAAKKAATQATKTGDDSANTTA